MESRYITSAAQSKQLPPYEEPEVAIIGRSNAGKSTLLNSLLGRQNLARAGRTPGQTKMVNFFSLNDRMVIADLPGYGFHKVEYSRATHWEELISAYLRRPNICDILFLMDIRRGVDEDDLNLLVHLSRQLPVVVALTKADKVNRMEGLKAAAKIKEDLQKKNIALDSVHVISSLKKTGIEPLRMRLFANRS